MGERGSGGRAAVAGEGRRGVVGMHSLAFHHHEKVYCDGEGRMWLSATLGMWLDELATGFSRVTLLMFASPVKTERHDHRLRSANIEWESLGMNLGYRDALSKRRRILRACKGLSGRTDWLLIRGFTPFQVLVWKALEPGVGRAFLLVRSLQQPREARLSDPVSWIAYAANKVRERGFGAILNSAGRLFTNSMHVKGELEATGVGGVTYSTTNVLKRREFEPFGFKAWTQRMKVLFVGRVSRLKGAEELVEAFISLCQLEPGLDIRLDFVGECAPADRAMMQRKMQAAGLGRRVCFHGRVAFGEPLKTLYREAHMFVLPSHTEGFPRVIWEAASFSLPIVATRVGGIPLLLQDGVHATLIEPADSTDLTQAMHRLLRDPDAAHRMARAAYELALDHTLEVGVGAIHKALNGQDASA